MKSVAMAEGERMCTVIIRVASVKKREGPESVIWRIEGGGLMTGSQEGNSMVGASQDWGCGCNFRNLVTSII